VARCDSTTLLDPAEEAFNDIASPVELWAETGPSPASLRVHGLAELAGADHTPYEIRTRCSMGSRNFSRGFVRCRAGSNFGNNSFHRCRRFYQAGSIGKGVIGCSNTTSLCEGSWRGSVAGRRTRGDRFLIAFDGPGRAHPLWDEHLAAGTLVGHRHRVETLFP
jgi:hypothetical protein